MHCDSEIFNVGVLVQSNILVEKGLTLSFDLRYKNFIFERFQICGLHQHDEKLLKWLMFMIILRQTIRPRHDETENELYAHYEAKPDISFDI